MGKLKKSGKFRRFFSKLNKFFCGGQLDMAQKDRIG